MTVALGVVCVQVVGGQAFVEVQMVVDVGQVARMR